MAAKLYDDVIGLARKESAQANHFYVGVEHLFIALTRIEGGVTGSTLQEQGIAPRFVRYMLRQELGQGDNRRFWPGFRETPRLQEVLRLANELAEERGQAELSERDLLLAILREGESVPCRVMLSMDVNLDRLEVMAANWSEQKKFIPVTVPVQVNDPSVTLTEEEEEVLQQMFRGYERVVIERALHGGYTSAKVLVASPFRADGHANASVVVKLDDRQVILYEKMRYDSYVRDTLPPATSRVLDNPIVPEKSALGGLKYTFIRDPDAPGPVDLADYGRDQGPEALAELLSNSLFRVFGETWWSQRHLYQFGAWQEYEMVLPPALVVEALPEEQVAHRRLTPLGQWSRRGRFVQGEIVSLEGFTVEDFYPSRQGMQLTSGSGPDAQNRAGKLEVRGIPYPSQKYYRGAVVDQIIGRVLYTRDDLLREQAEMLQPGFDLSSEWLPLNAALGFQLPNPIRRYANILQRRLSGSLSTIHGDLHLHNVLVGPGGNAWLIDFAQTREGHTLFDWAVLEASLITEYIEAYVQDEDWDTLWKVVASVHEIGQTLDRPPGNSELDRALGVIATVRHIVKECLADPDDWREYHIALALTLLRGLRWTRTVSLKGRRLLFLLAALSMSAATRREGIAGAEPDLDATDFNLDVTDIISGAQVQEALRAAAPKTSGKPASHVASQGSDATRDGLETVVQFLASYARAQAPGEWQPVSAYVFRGLALDRVMQDAQGESGEDRIAPLGGGRSLPAGLRIVARPSLSGFQFNPAQVSVDFYEDWHRLDFRMRAMGAAPHVPHVGFITFWAEGVLIAEVPLIVTVGEAAGPRTVGSPVQPYRHVFVSYSPADTVLIARLQQVHRALSMDFLRDVVDLHERDEWNDRLLRMVDRADVFQLYWSKHAASSAVVAREWQHAVALTYKERFVRPVYVAQDAPDLPAPLAALPVEFLDDLV
ncbi:MAG: TIR domain-containing protein [Anaerolineae bacterium]|nr:TIR domain-containing protein [Anaerolineae bacterium]